MTVSLITRLRSIPTPGTHPAATPLSREQSLSCCVSHGSAVAHRARPRAGSHILIARSSKPVLHSDTRLRRRRIRATSRESSPNFNAPTAGNGKPFGHGSSSVRVRIQLFSVPTTGLTVASLSPSHSKQNDHIRRLAQRINAVMCRRTSTANSLSAVLEVFDERQQKVANLARIVPRRRRRAEEREENETERSSCATIRSLARCSPRNAWTRSSMSSALSSTSRISIRRVIVRAPLTVARIQL